MPCHKRRDGGELAVQQENLGIMHRKVGARIEHGVAQVKNWKILRDYRRVARTPPGSFWES